MVVTFRRLVEQRTSTWDALIGRRRRVPGSTMALGRGDMPHDLTQLLVEGALGVHDGFWGSIAAGATFKSTGRRRTRPGRAVIARNREGLVRAEALAGEHLARWRAGESTPAAAHLDAADALWSSLRDERDALTVEWPSLRLGRTRVDA